jgi:hypothetical protein
VSEARNGTVKPIDKKEEAEEHTPSNNKLSMGIKKGLVGKITSQGGSGKGRSDSKESSQSKNEERKEASTFKKGVKEAEEKRKEEARLKKEELERKKKEDLDKKKKIEEAKTTGSQSRQVPTKQNTKNLDGNNDDPIERSLNERIALGGVTQVAKSADTGKPVVSKPPPKIVKIPKDKEEDKGSETPRNNKVKVAVEKHIGDKISKALPGKKGGKDDGDDDPIEKSLNERIALGGVTQVAKSANPVKPVVSKPVKVVKEKVAEEDKTGENKVKVAVEKHIGEKVGKLVGNKKGGKDDDTDDPIA